jgi:hypothetical protein
LILGDIVALMEVSLALVLARVEGLSLLSTLVARGAKLDSPELLLKEHYLYQIGLVMSR